MGAPFSEVMVRASSSARSPMPVAMRPTASIRSSTSPWSTSEVEERIDAVGRIATGMGERAEELARTITSENGAPIGFSRLGQVGAPIDILHSMMGIARDYPWEARHTGRYVDYLERREPCLLYTSPS